MRLLVSPEKMQRIADAYQKMAALHYRPAAPSDGFGNITVLEDELDIGKEIHNYTLRFLEEDDRCTYDIGCTDFRFIRSFMWSLEAIRLMCAGDIGSDSAIVTGLLREAANEYERESGG